jgi:uncharacterized membrane protein
MTAYEPPRHDDNADKALSIINYVILFIAPFVAGFPSLVAAIIAYVRRGSASPLMRSHYDFQIRIFWVGIALGVLGVALIIFALGSGVGAALAGAGAWFETAVGIGAWAVLLFIGGVFALIGNFFWYIIASLIGFIRLLDGRPMGRAAPVAGPPTVVA